MTGIVWFLVCLVAIGLVLRAIWRRRTQLIPERGTSVRADVGVLHDVPRVRLSDVQMVGTEVARIVFVAVDAEHAAAAEDAMLVSISEREQGFAILRGWYEQGSILGLVIPPDSRLVRLRGLDDLQPLTLRRVDID